jgi:hypothetical protein
MPVCVSGLYCLGIVNGVAGRFLESYQILNMVFSVGVLRVCMTVCSLGVVTVVQVKRGLSGTRLLGVVVCKLKGREKRLPVLILKCKGSDELLNNLNRSFRLPICLRVFGC